MTGLDEISRVIGGLETKIEHLTAAVTALTATVQDLQKSKWTARGLIAGLSLGGGAIGSKILEAFSGSSPPPNFPH